MSTQQYIDNLNKRFQTGISREHAYRGDLQLVLETLLKDRKEGELSFDYILHYQKIIVALKETDRIMKEIDKIEI